MLHDDAKRWCLIFKEWFLVRNNIWMPKGQKESIYTKSKLKNICLKILPKRQQTPTDTYWIDARILTSLSAFCLSFSVNFPILTWHNSVSLMKLFSVLYQIIIYTYLFECILLTVWQSSDFIYRWKCSFTYWKFVLKHAQRELYLPRFLITWKFYIAPKGLI